jgi:hypothetical protein
MKRRDPAGDDPRLPSWLTEQCPSWCARDHREHDHPEDRYHQSEASLLPGVVAARQAIPFTASLEGIELVAWLGRYIGEGVDCVVIEPAERREPRLVVTVETAHSLVRHLSEQLARHQRS